MVLKRFSAPSATRGGMIPPGLLSAPTSWAVPCQQMISEQEDGRERTGKMNSQAKLENFHIFHSPSQRIPGGGTEEVPRGQSLLVLHQQFMGLQGEKTSPALHSLPMWTALLSPSTPSVWKSKISSSIQVLHVANALSCLPSHGTIWLPHSSLFFLVFFLVFFFSKCQLWPLERLFL